MKPAKKTESETMNKQSIIIRNRIMQLLGMVELQYYNTLFESVYVYFDYVISIDSEKQNTFLSSPLFWKWWKRQYELADEFFISEMDRYSFLSSLPQKELLKRYISLHTESDFYPDNDLITLIESKVYSINI